MPSYLYSANAPDGRKIHERIEAASLDQARSALELYKYSDIEFLTDENGSDIARAARSGTDVPAIDPAGWTAEDEVQVHRHRGLVQKLWWVFKKHAVIFAALAIWNVTSWRGGRPLIWLDWVGFIATPLYCLWFIKLVLPMVLFQLILEASVWHDWIRLRRFIRWARQLRRFMVTGIPDNELDIREAQSLAAEGRLAEGLQLVEKYRGHPDVAEYVFLSRVAGIYEAAGQYDRTVALFEESAARGPGGVSEWIDLAMARVQLLHDAAGARTALQKIEGRELPALAKAFRLIVEGTIAGEERDDLRACESYRAGLAKLQATSGNPLVLGLVAEVRAGLAISLARLGRKELARKILAGSRPLLEARKEAGLLARCDKALEG